MAVLNIRRLSDDVHAALRLRAARNGRSMEAEARDILGRACDAAYEAVEGSSLARDADGPGSVTIRLTPQLAAAARDYARRRATTVEDLMRQLLDREVVVDTDAWCDDLFARMDAAGGDSHGVEWTRDELYERT